MPYDFHEDRKLYFSHQTMTTNDYIIPFIEQGFKIEAGMQVLEIGCAEAGVLKAFTERGCTATGVDLAENKLDIARQMMAEEQENGRIEFINKNIYEESFKEQFRGRFDLVILKDVIEHIHDQKNLLSYLHTFLKSNGVIFFGFPPWYMPFGGHQQMCVGPLKKMPYFHLLPMPLYKFSLKKAGESAAKIESLAEIKQTGISIERFEKILKQTAYGIVNKKYFLFNPIYKFKFNLQPREQFKLISALPYLRNFLTTSMYYLVKPV